MLGFRSTLGIEVGKTSAGGTPFYMAPEIVAALLFNKVLECCCVLSIAHCCMNVEFVPHVHGCPDQYAPSYTASK